MPFIWFVKAGIMFIIHITLCGYKYRSFLTSTYMCVEIKSVVCKDTKSGTGDYILRRVRRAGHVGTVADKDLIFP